MAQKPTQAVSPEKRQQITRVRRFIVFIVVSLILAHIFILFNLSRIFQNLL